MQYAEKPVKTKLEEDLDKLSIKDRAKEKVKELVKIGKKSFNKNGYDIEIVEIRLKDDLLKVVVEVKKNENIITGIETEYLYKNPPLKISNGTYRIENEIDIENFEVNIEEALKSIVAQTVKYSLDKKGEL